MHSQLVIVLLVGLAASAYALDLSHANKRSLETEPRLFGLLSDLYAQVIYPPLNHVVTNLALLGAQVLAGISQTGIPAPGGRVLHPSEAQLRGFWTDLWNNALKPPLENALSGVSLLAAQVLAGVATNGVNLGKRDLTEAEMRGFWEDFLNNAILGPVNDALQGVALLGAQLLAGVATNGVNLGKRDLTEAEMRGFWEDFLNNAILGPVNNALQGVALLGAQVLAGVATNGVNLGKRDLTEAEMRGFLDDLTAALNNVFSNVIQKPLEDALAGGALMLAQVLAGAGTNGINLSGLLGKRDLTEAEMRGFWEDFLNNAILGPVNNALQGVALLGAQVLAGVATNGVNLGKRDLTEAEMRGFLDDLTAALNSVFSNVIQKPLEDALAGGALMLAQVLAGAGTNGINLSGLLGKRDLSELAGRQEELRGFFDTLGNALLDSLQTVWTNVLQNPVEQALQSGALLGAQVLAGLGTNGVNLSTLFGKRDTRGIFDDLVAHANGLIQTQVIPIVENALNNAAIHLAGVLATFAQGGLGRR
jgi:hypothetical protein